MTAIILAAGKSERMGEAKALVRFREKSFLQTVLDNIQAAGVKRTLVVLGHDANFIASQSGLAPSDFLLNKQYERGQFSSFQTGLRGVAADCEGVLLALVDQPQIPVEIYQTVIAVSCKHRKQIIIPTCNKKRGHPTIFPAELFTEILAASPNTSAAFIIRKNSNKIHEVEVNDERILWNLNTRAELDEVRRRFTPESGL